MQLSGVFFECYCACPRVCLWSHKEIHNFPRPGGSWVPGTFEKHIRKSCSLPGRRVDWKKEGMESVEFLVTPQNECEGCKRLEEEVHVLQQKDRWRDFLVLAGELVSRLFEDDIYYGLKRLEGEEHSAMKGLSCWDDVATALKPLTRPRSFTPDKVERAKVIQKLIQKIAQERFGLNPEEWESVRKLKNDRNDEFHCDMEDEVLLAEVDSMKDCVKNLSKVATDALKTIIQKKRDECV
eukprot:TRINITY_DN1026_c0_g4_i1.p1 TRINITY_DN1026_c0_g4~~TRINITY_DN1026_c0_g4_i1.p1  ORF type:complete len:238 (-),score=47.70 TRINITY_DN1026_c0_g4_i1:324-1037(-)